MSALLFFERKFLQIKCIVRYCYPVSQNANHSFNYRKSKNYVVQIIQVYMNYVQGGDVCAGLDCLFPRDIISRTSPCTQLSKVNRKRSNVCVLSPIGRGNRTYGAFSLFIIWVKIFYCKKVELRNIKIILKYNFSILLQNHYRSRCIKFLLFFHSSFK